MNDEIRRLSTELVLVEDKEVIMQKDDLILVESGTITEISALLLAIGQKIQDYCGKRVKTNIHMDNGILNVRFQISYGRYIEYETPDDRFMLSINEKNYYVLRLKNLSHYSPMCLVRKIMRDVFGL